MSETVLIIAEIIVGIALLGVLSAVITVIVVRMLPAGRSRAAEILDERYARGELTRDQYDQMQGELESVRPGTRSGTAARAKPI